MSKVTTLIVTMNTSYNYGAVLQAYALQTTLNKIGINSVFLDQRTGNTKKLDYSINKMRDIPRALLKIINKRKICEGYRKFEEFIDNYEYLTKQFADYEDLKQNPPLADIYLTGSDQVWNPNMIREVNFLQFAPLNVKCISYAASMGNYDLNIEKEQKLKKYLGRFQAISVREELAKECLNKIVSVPINVNIDAVFLLTKNEWKKIANAVNIDSNYILLYILYHPKWLNNLLKSIKKVFGLKLILVDNSEYRSIVCDKHIKNAGPKEFLSLINNAKYVITSSFHGTAFSIIFNKPFYAIPNPKAPDRIQNLLNIFNLQNNILTEEKSKLCDIAFKMLDDESIEKKINEKKNEAINYLKKNLRI